MFEDGRGANERNDLDLGERTGHRTEIIETVYLLPPILQSCREQTPTPAPACPSITEERLLIKEGSARSCLEIADEVKLSCEREQFSISSFRLLLRAKMKGSVILHVFDIQIFEIMPGLESRAARYELLAGEFPFTSFSATQTICMRNEWIEY